MGKQITPGQALRFGAELATCIHGSDLPQDAVQQLLEDRKRMVELGKEQVELIRAFATEKPETITNLLAGWQAFYVDVFGLDPDFSRLAIPAERKGFDRLLVVARGITPQRAYEACAKLFPCWKWWVGESLDGVIDPSFQVRSAKDGSYAIWVRGRVEADDELRKLSADVLAERGVPCITLEERLLYEAKYFNEAGKHLDVQNYTLCTGSRCRDGSVPGVGWDGRYYFGRLKVDRFAPAYSGDGLRSREVVS